MPKTKPTQKKQKGRNIHHDHENKTTEETEKQPKMKATWVSKMGC